jgi:hypothetical protein
MANRSDNRGNGDKNANVLAFDIIQMTAVQGENPIEKNRATVNLGS